MSQFGVTQYIKKCCADAVTNKMVEKQPLQVLIVRDAPLRRHVFLGFLRDLGGEGSHQPVERRVVEQILHDAIQRLLHLEEKKQTNILLPDLLHRHMTNKRTAAQRSTVLVSVGGGSAPV